MHANEYFDSKAKMEKDGLFKKYPNLLLRKPGTAGSGQRWTLENLRDGLQYFFDTNNRYPDSIEIDNFDFLPSSRAIQRSFGGLVVLRTKLGLTGPTNFNTGILRSTRAKEADLRARVYEEEFYYYLISKIPEYKVHEHKVLRPGNVSSDFFIYTSEKDGIVVDLFYAKDIKSLAGIVVIKTRRYRHVPFPVYYVLVGNEQITQNELDKLVNNKDDKLPKHIKLCTALTFKELIKTLQISHKNS